MSDFFDGLSTDWSTDVSAPDIDTSTTNVNQGATLGGSGNADYLSSYGQNNSLSGSNGSTANDWNWLVDTTDPSVNNGTWISVWNWLQSNQGSTITGTALKALLQQWQANQALANNPNIAIAKMQDARIREHNASINQTMDMGLSPLTKAQ